MPAKPDISESEWKVMKILWAQSPLPAYDIIEKLKDAESWHPSTVKTLLSRLTKKGVLGTRKYKNLFHYFPLVSQEEVVQAESKSFMERVFDGSVQPLLLHFVKQEKLTKEQIKELKTILQEKGK